MRTPTLPSGWTDIGWLGDRRLTTRVIWTVAVATTIVLSLGVVVAQAPARAVMAPITANASVSRSTAEGAVFLGAPERGARGAEKSARALAVALGGLPVEPIGLVSWLTSASFTPLSECPNSRLRVSWEPPVGDYQIGAYVAPLGPKPTLETERVNGVVLCEGSTYAYLGFEAAWDGARWRLRSVPSLAKETEAEILEGEADAAGAQPAETTGTSPGQLPEPSEWAGTPIEPLAPYVPQTTCDPTAKPGVLGFRDLLLTTFPGTRNGNIGRACEHIGLSEHKEGRAFDWYVDAANPTERAAAETVLAWMFATDSEGNEFAIARRLGVMYVIWDGHIWSALLAHEGWRPFFGVNAHTDHVHVSFSWDGALAQTTFWKGISAPRAGSDVPDLPLIPVPAKPPILAGVSPPTVRPSGSAPAAPSSHSPSPQPTADATSRPAAPESNTDDGTDRAPSGGSGSSSPSPSTTTTTSQPPTTTTTTSPPPPVTVPSPPPTSFGINAL